MSKPLILVVFVSILLLGGALFFKYGDFLKKPTVDSSTLPQAQNNEPKSQDENKDAPRVAVLAQNLEIPWSLVFLPDNSALVTERPGRVRHVSGDGRLQDEPVFVVSDVKHISEGGLLGITSHPNYSQNGYVYLYYTYSGDSDTLNRVARYKFDGKTFTDRKVIVDAIPGAGNHNGGRIKFGPDGFLYITTGDAQEPSQSQDKNSLAGKILRVTDEGKAAGSNPFNNPVYSYGHRNPQGIVWDSQGRLWETEHGQSSQDEVNLVKPGSNYGWPDSRGDSVGGGTTGPIEHSGNNSTWAPSGIAFLDGALYFTGLRGASLFKAKIENEDIDLTKHFEGEFGRLRDVVVGPDGLLYILTNNRDGRGRLAAGDDKILVVNPQKL